MGCVFKEGASQSTWAAPGYPTTAGNRTSFLTFHCLNQGGANSILTDANWDLPTKTFFRHFSKNHIINNTLIVFIHVSNDSHLINPLISPFYLSP